MSASILGLDSTIHKDQMSLYHQSVVNQMASLTNYFEEQQEAVFDDTGYRIINATSENIWFRDNIAFIFATGMVFNQQDKERADEIFSLFEPQANNAVLHNFHKLYNYETPLIQAIEERMILGNGNYHLCLILVVNTDDPDVLAHAPEDRFKTPGVIEKYCEWDAIYTYMSEAISKYGLVANIQQIDVGDQLTSTPSSMNIMKYDELVCESPEAYAMEREFITYRDEYLNKNRPEVYLHKDSRSEVSKAKTKNKQSLYKRMHEVEKHGAVFCDIPRHLKGVESRADMYRPDKLMAMKKEKARQEAIEKGTINTIEGNINEFRLYDNEDTYDNGYNVYNQIMLDDMANIPSFGGVKRGHGKRHV